MLDTFSRWPKRGLTFIVMAMLGFSIPGAGDPAQGQDGKPAASKSSKRGKKKKGRKTRREDEKPPTMADAIGNVTPIGRGHRELVIPRYDSVTGKRSSTIEVASVEREDEVTLRLRGLDVREYGPDGLETLRIEVRSGYFDLTTGILTGDSLSRVSVPTQFEIVGAGLICDTSVKEVEGKKTRAQFGKMLGPVRMTIYGGGKMALAPTDKHKSDDGKSKAGELAAKQRLKKPRK